MAVSIDGLQPEHDARRAPATYERILKNIAGQSVTVHCTVTGQMMKRPGYLAEFLEFWTPRPEIKKVWFSLFTPQVGDDLPEMLTATERVAGDCGHAGATETVSEAGYVGDRDSAVCFAATLAAGLHFRADHSHAVGGLTSEITPCQFGGTPDCGSCGCVASMGLASVAAHKLGGFISVGAIFNASIRIGRVRAKSRARQQAKETQRRLRANEEAWAHQDGREGLDDIAASLPRGWVAGVIRRGLGHYGIHGCGLL